MTAELDIQECVYCGQVIELMPTLYPEKGDSAFSAHYYCGNCESNFTLYFDEDENGVLTKI